MSDKEIKDRIQAALDILNAAFRDAANAGLTITLEELDVTTMGDPVRVLFVGVEVTRVTKV